MGNRKETYRVLVGNTDGRRPRGRWKTILKLIL
jgi:hypothetical protein